MNLLERVIATVAPHNCLSCGAEGQLVCAWCWPDFCLPLPERCYCCSKLSTGSQVCQACRHSSPLKFVWVRTSYDNGAKNLVYRLKFHRTSTAAETIGKFMTEALPYLPQDTLVVHIPTASSRVRQRGYDQSKLIAKALASGLGLKHTTLLLRLGQTRQVGTKRDERVKQLEKAFVPLHPALIKSRNILLVDDVLTTRATIESAAKVLRKAGAKSVSAVIFAQKQL